MGDPGRALFLAQQLLVAPAPMFNHHRGLWGYSGPAASGKGNLLIQGAGMGGPSLTAVVMDLIGLGARTFVRVGTASATNSSGLCPGGILIAQDAVAADGASSALASGEQIVSSDPGLMASAAADLQHEATVGRVLSCDIPQDPPVWSATHSSAATDMSTAALYALCSREGLAALSMLVITGTQSDPLTEDDLNSTVGVAGATAARLLQA